MRKLSRGAHWMTMQGRTRLLKRLAAVQGKPRKAMRAALETGAKQIADAARRLAPVDSGDLRASIGYTAGEYKPANTRVRGVSGGGGGDPDLSFVVHAGDAKAFYAAFVEFGTSSHDAGGMFEGAQHPGTTAEPYFYPAYRINRRSVKSRVTRAMKKAIRDAASE